MLFQWFVLQVRRQGSRIELHRARVEMTEPARESLDPVGVRAGSTPWILEEHPAQVGIFILRRSAKPQLPDGESSEYLLVQHTFGARALARHTFGDHGRAVAS